MSDKAFPPNPIKLIGRASRGFTKLADGALRDHGFATGQLPVLGSLKGGVARSQAELARIAQVEQPSMAQLLNRMERDGLVERVPDPADKRSRLISLTPPAAKRMHLARRVMEGLLEEALTGFNEQEIEQLMGLLLRLIENIDRMNAEQDGSQG